MEHIEVLESLLKATEEGDDDGFIPDLSYSEIEAIRWAKDKLISINEYYPELFLK